MLTIEQIREELQDRRLQMVAKGAGLTYPTVQKIRDGNAVKPSYETIKALSDYLEGKK